MDSKQIAQHFHDAFTEVAAGLSSEMAGMAPPEEIVRGLMLGAASFTAAAWVASTKASGVDHGMTRMTMLGSMADFYNQALIPQTLRG